MPPSDCPLTTADRFGALRADFLVAADGDRWVIETKADRDLQSENVQGKREAARCWANHATADERVSERWHNVLVGETDLRQAKDDWNRWWPRRRSPDW